MSYLRVADGWGRGKPSAFQRTKIARVCTVVASGKKPDQMILLQSHLSAEYIYILRVILSCFTFSISTDRDPLQLLRIGCL